MNDYSRPQPNKYIVIADYESPYPDPIVFSKGERVQIGEKYSGDPEWENWIWCTGESGQQAWCPTQFISGEGGGAVINKEYNAMELTIKAGDVLSINEMINGFAMAEDLSGKRGWVPLRNIRQLNE